MTKIAVLHGGGAKTPTTESAYDAMGDEFDLVRSLIDARPTVRLAQPWLAAELKTARHAGRASTRKRACTV